MSPPCPPPNESTPLCSSGYGSTTSCNGSSSSLSSTSTTGNNAIDGVKSMQSSSSSSDPESLTDRTPDEPTKGVSHSATIGMLGSVSIAVNSLVGPAILNLPATYQRSGLIPTTATLLLVSILSALCSLHMANVISKVPGNQNFQREVEFSESFRIFWGQKAFVFTQITFFLCITCLNVSSIVDTAQVVDTFLGHHAGQSIALQVSPSPMKIIRWSALSCTTEQIEEGSCIPFHDNRNGSVLLSAGYILSGFIFLPLCLMDLKENTAWQIFGFGVLLINSLQFITSFLKSGLSFDNVTLWGESWDTLLGVILFNFAVVVAIPAWLYEKSPTVNVPTVIHGSFGVSTMLYILVGALGALSIPNVSENMLESMMSGSFGPWMQLGATFFAFFIIGLGIPLFSVLTRLNLTGSGLCSRSTGNALAVYLPWSISWMLYRGTAIAQLLSWGGTLFTSAVAFILPLLLALHTLLEFDERDSIDVYCGLIQSRSGRKLALYLLLGISTAAVVIAIAGQFLLGAD